MKLCRPHWEQLKAAIAELGMMHLVAESGKIASERITAQLENKDHGFDPLMNANFAIWTNALELGGKYLMWNDENGNPYCPICESEKHKGNDAEWWIKNASEEQLARARSLGLMPPDIAQ